MYLETTFHNVVQLFVPRRAHLPGTCNTQSPGRGWALAAMRSSPLHQGYQQQDDEQDSFREGTSFRNSFGVSAVQDEGRGGDWRNGLVNTLRLWNRVTPLFSFGNLALLAAITMTIYAQMLITKLPVYVGKATKELTGGTTGAAADPDALWHDISLAFLIVFVHVSLRGCCRDRAAPGHRVDRTEQLTQPYRHG